MIRLLFPSLFVSVTLFAGQTQKADEQKPNILFILSDDHSAPFLGCYGNPDLKTPNIDKLASEGVLFKHAYTAAPQCVPSRATMLTGRNVLDVQMLRFSAPLDKEIVTFPELLRDAGYYTGICGRSYHLDGSGKRPVETQQVFDEFGMETFRNRVDYLKSGGNKQVLDQFREFLNQKPGEKPFFMWANYSDPHRIFDAKEFEPAPESIHLPARFPDTKLLRQDFAGYLGEMWKDLQFRYTKNELDKKFEGTTIFAAERPMFEFFDLRNDPDEFVNVSDKEQYREQEHQLKTELHRWMIINRDCVPLPIPPAR